MVSFVYGRKFPLSLNGAVYKSNVELLYAGEACCLKEYEMQILRRTKRSIVRAVCEVQLKNKKRSMVFMFGLSETIDQLAMANSVRWNGHVLRREDGYILSRAFDFLVEGQRKKGRTLKRQDDEESVQVGLRNEDALYLSKRSVGDCCWFDVNLTTLTF